MLSVPLLLCLFTFGASAAQFTSIVTALSNTAALANLFQDIPAGVLNDLQTDETDAVDFVCFLLFDGFNNVTDVPAIISAQGNINQSQFASDLQASSDALTDFFGTLLNSTSEAVQNVLLNQCYNDPAVSSAFADESTTTTDAGAATTTSGPCDYFTDYSSGCLSTDSGTIPLTAQESCLCYAPVGPTSTQWVPGVFDGIVSSCYSQVSTNQVSAPEVSSFLGYCSRAGDVLGLGPTTSASSTSLPISSATPQATPTTSARGTQTQASVTSATPTGAASPVLVPGLDTVVIKLSACFLVALFVL